MHRCLCDQTRTGISPVIKQESIMKYAIQYEINGKLYTGVVWNNRNMARRSQEHMEYMYGIAAWVVIVPNDSP